MSYNIYASSPGILVKATDFDAATAAGAPGPVVLLPYASTIGNALTVKDADGRASALTPIIVSTIFDAYYARTLSTSIISSVKITDAGGAVAVASLQPRTYTLLQGSFVQRTPPSSLRPNYEQISTISTYTTTIFSTLVLQPTVSLDTLLSFNAPPSLTAEFTSTLAMTTQATNLYSAFSAPAHSFFSTGSLSTNVAYASTLGAASFNTSNYTGLGRVDICGNTLTTVGGNYSTITGGLLTNDSSARIIGNTLVRGAFSTTASLIAYGAGGIQVRDNFAGASYMSVGSVVVRAAGTFGSNFYVRGTATLSTLIVHSGAAYTSSMTVGEPAGSSAAAAWDLSGAMFVTAQVNDPTTINANIMSTALLYGSSFNVYDKTTFTFRPLYVQSGQLIYDGTIVGSVVDNTGSNIVTSNWVSTTNMYTSTALIGTSTYRTTFNFDVNGGIKVSDMSGVRLRVAGGEINGADSNTTLAWSTDGITWNNSSSGGFTQAAYGLGWNGRIWVAVGADSTSSNTIKTSRDGSNWVGSLSGAFAAEGHAVSWDGVQWVAVGKGSGTTTIKTSTDGRTWNNIQSGGFNTIGNDVMWNGRIWVATGDIGVSQSNIQYSYNGSNWFNAATNAFDGSGNGLAWNGRVWVAVGSDTTQNKRIKWSLNGINWSDSSGNTAFNVIGNDVCWTGQIFTAVGQDTGGSNNSIKFSYDGVTWSNASSGGFSNATNIYKGNHVTYDGDKWIAAGLDTVKNGLLKYSYDGRNWINSAGHPFLASSNAFTVAYAYDTVPRLQVAGLEFYDSVNPFLRSTNTIFTQATLFASTVTHSTSMVINNTLYINPPIGVSINIDPSVLGSSIALYVYGSTFVNVDPLKLGGGNWLTPSDSRLKNEIQNASITNHCMCKMKALDQKEFNYKDEAMCYVNLAAFERRNAYIEENCDCCSIAAKLDLVDLSSRAEVSKELGFIAQEVAAVIPEAVEPIFINGGEYKGLNYEQIRMIHLATTHALMSTMEIQESTLKGQDSLIQTLYGNYATLRDLLGP